METLPAVNGRRILVWALLAAAAAAVWLAGRPRGGVPAGGEIDWSREPVQTPTDREPFELETSRGALTIVPRASYDVAARVEGAERYRFDDLAFLSPLDLLLTWGELPTSRYRDALEYSQSWRFYFWRTADLGLDADYVISHSANTHLIPADEGIERALLTIDAGDDVRLTGLLVDVRGESFRWSTSTVRTDHGDGGCEILWVEAVEAGGRRWEIAAAGVGRAPGAG